MNENTTQEPSTLVPTSATVTIMLSLVECSDMCSVAKIMVAPTLVPGKLNKHLTIATNIIQTVLTYSIWQRQLPENVVLSLVVT